MNNQPQCPHCHVPGVASDGRIVCGNRQCRGYRRGIDPTITSVSRTTRNASYPRGNHLTTDEQNILTQAMQETLASVPPAQRPRLPVPATSRLPRTLRQAEQDEILLRQAMRFAGVRQPAQRPQAKKKSAYVPKVNPSLYKTN